MQIPSFDINSIYNENKEINDKNFNTITVLEDTVHNRTIIAHFKINEISNIKINTKQEDGNFVREEFATIDELTQKYPEYLTLIENSYTNNYVEYVTKLSWKNLLSEREKTLSEDCSKFSPWPELLQLVQEQADVKNEGGVTDGYDHFYHYLLGDNSPEYRYKFYETFNLKPEKVAMHLTSNYYQPLLKNNSVEKK